MIVNFPINKIMAALFIWFETEFLISQARFSNYFTLMNFQKLLLNVSFENFNKKSINRDNEGIYG